MSKYLRWFLKSIQNTRYYKIKLGTRDKEQGAKDRDVKRNWTSDKSRSTLMKVRSVKRLARVNHKFVLDFASNRNKEETWLVPGVAGP